MRRVVVTGMGIVSPIGIGKEEVLMNLERSTVAIDYISSFDASNLPVRIAAEVKNFDVEKYIDRKLARRTDRFVHFALAAFKEALDQAKIDLSLFSERTAVLVASGMGGFITLDTENNKFLAQGASKVSPFLIPMLLINMASGIISIEHGLKGVNFSPVSACASSGHAIALGTL
jgi:3-oxoacyl-[acyl-carrier-protein] synthase II (EC 2.3.1.41)